MIKFFVEKSLTQWIFESSLTTRLLNYQQNNTTSKKRWKVSRVKLPTEWPYDQQRLIPRCTAINLKVLDKNNKS